MRIVITAFEAQANAGTEAGLAWQWGRAYSALGHEVSVVAHSDDRLGDDSGTWRSAGIDIIRLGSPATRVSAPQGIRSLLEARARYGTWMALARDHVTSLHPDLHHHVSWGSIRLPPPVLDAATTTVWGPLGGGQHPVWRGIPPFTAPAEIFRSATFSLQQSRVRQVVSRTALTAFVTNRETERAARRLRLNAIPMLADGVDPHLLAPVARSSRANSAELRLMWSGRMVGTKRPDLAIRVAHELRRRRVNVSLTMLGDGPERSRLERLSARLETRSIVEFPGRVSWDEMQRHYARNDALLFHSMRDSSCPGVVEAAAHAMPSIALRVQGLAAHVPEAVAPGPTRMISTRQVVGALADSAQKLVDDETYRCASEAALEFASSETWPNKVARVMEATQ